MTTEEIIKIIAALKSCGEGYLIDQDGGETPCQQFDDMLVWEALRILRPLDPDRIIGCPVCKATSEDFFSKEDPTPMVKATPVMFGGPALEVECDSRCECRNCGHVWMTPFVR